MVEYISPKMTFSVLLKILLLVVSFCLCSGCAIDAMQIDKMDNYAEE